MGIDSLDLLTLARAVSRFFDLYESGSEEFLLQRRTIGGWVRTVLDATSDVPPHLTFRTSGSTGEPVDCRHALASLAAEIEIFAGLLEGRTRVVGIVPRHHIYGFLFTVLLPARLGVTSLDLRGASVAEIVRSLRPGDLLVGFPLRWDEIAEARLPLIADVVGVTSTGPCRAQTIAALRALGLETMFEVYGSSQTAGIAWRREPGAPYRLLPYWSLDANRDVLRRDGARDGAPGATFPLPDRIEPRGDGFDVVGRTDGAVSVGGVNVFPSRIAEAIKGYPDVVDCAVRPMRAGEGARLKAFVVFRPEAAESPEVRDAFRRWLDANFMAAERPKPITFGPVLPRDAQGKSIDW